MTVLEVIQRGTEFLTRKGVESPRLQMELLLSHLLQMPRLKLYLNFERTLDDPELGQLRELVKRRSEREPLQQILGSTSFCGLEIAVNRDVLVPRPETEVLAERAWKFLQDRAAAGPPPPRALDFGAGSGCLAITLAVKCPQAEIHAVDVSEAALNVARQNAVRNQVQERIQFHPGDGFAALPAELRFDLVVSNPPYIPTAVIETLEPEVRDYEPRAALDGGADGLDYYRRLAVEAVPFSASEGHAMLELGDGQGEAVREIFQQQGWAVAAIEPDNSGRPRIFIAHRPK